MVDATIRITVPSEKWKEVLQTLKSLGKQIRQEQGCISCNCYLDMEIKNTICLREEWKTREDLDTHLKSVHFSVLIGAMKLLNVEPEIRFDTILSSAGVEAITAARK